MDRSVKLEGACATWLLTRIVALVKTDGVPTAPIWKGMKRRVVVEGNGGLLGVAIAGANVYDTQ